MSLSYPVPPPLLSLPCSSPPVSLAGLPFGVSLLKYKQIATVSILPPFLIHKRLPRLPLLSHSTCQASALRSRSDSPREENVLCPAGLPSVCGHLGSPWALDIVELL